MRKPITTRLTKHQGLSAPSTIFATVVLGLALSTVSWAFFRSSHFEVPQPATVLSRSDSLPFNWDNKDFVPLPADTSSGRPIFPYSVIPRGVMTSRELQAAIHNDSVVSSHYSNFNVHSAHVIRLAQERQAYVSYRLGDRIFWTKKRVTMHAGETLLTDGVHLARTRCGNRISDVPVAPTSPAEPADETMNPPVAPSWPDLTTKSLPIPPIWMDSPAPILFASGNGPYPPSGPGTLFLSPSPVGSCCGNSSSPPSSQPLTAPPVVSPEPSAFVLLITGLAAFLIIQFLGSTAPFLHWLWLD